MHLVLEHVICSSLLNHLESHWIITNRQHAFQKGLSFTTQLYTVIRDWPEATDQGLQTDAFILDIAKAFDSVLHERLKTKLNRYGIDERLWDGLTASFVVDTNVSLSTVGNPVGSWSSQVFGLSEQF